MIHLEKPDKYKQKFEVVSCFIEVKDTFLLLLRNENKPQGNTWAIPAGKVEENESLEEALKREISEELSLDISQDKLIYINKVYIRYPTFDYVYHMYRYTFDEIPDFVVNQNEHTQHMWTTPQEALTKTLIPGEIECINLCYKL